MITHILGQISLWLGCSLDFSWALSWRIATTIILRQISDLLLSFLLGLWFGRLRFILLLIFLRDWHIVHSCRSGCGFMALFQWLDALTHRWAASALLEARLHVVGWLLDGWCLFAVVNISLNLLILLLLLLKDFLLILLLNFLWALRWLLHGPLWVHIWWFLLMCVISILVIELRFWHDLLLWFLEGWRACLENLDGVGHLWLDRLCIFNGNGLLSARWARNAHWNGGQVLLMSLPDPLRVGSAALDGFTHNVLN